MKKLLLLHLLLAMFFGVQTVKADVVLNEANFPDATFRSYISEKTGVSEGGTISDAALASVTWFSVSYKEISSLQGIEYFTELKQLYCSNNKITSLDLSKNTKLTNLECDYNQLTSLDLSKNTALHELHCVRNQLTSLDVSKNAELKNLYCNYNQLTSIDVSKNTKLTILNIGQNQLTSLDVSKNTNLTDLICGANPISSIDVTKNTKLGLLDCGASQLSSLDVTKNMQLKKLYCGENNISTLNLSNNTELEILTCANCKINQLDLSNNTNLTTLRCQGNQLTSLDVRLNTNLTTLECIDNQLASLDVSNNTKLKNLLCSSNNIGTLYLSKNTELEYLDCSSNKIDQLNLSNNTKLTTLMCTGNRLTNLKLDDNTALINSNYVSVGSQSSTRRFQRMSNGSNVNDCWALPVGTTDASRICNLKIDGVSKTPSFVPRNSDGWLIVSDDLKKIPLKVEYEFNTGNAVAGWMPVTVNYDVKKYGVYIAGEELTSLNFHDIPGLKEGTAYFLDEYYDLGWSGISPTLVLENAKIEGEEGIRNEDCYNLNIIVRGNNEVTATNYNAFSNNCAAGWTTFSGGNSVGGFLRFTATGDRWHGIYACDSYIRITEATKIIAQGDGYGYFDDNSILYISDNAILACYGNKYPSVELPVESQFKIGQGIDIHYPVGAYISGHHVYYAGTTTDVQGDWVVIGPDLQSTQNLITGISLTEEGRSQTEDGAIYNLAGQRLSKTQRGINIVGGKKIIRE